MEGDSDAPAIMVGDAFWRRRPRHWVGRLDSEMEGNKEAMEDKERGEEREGCRARHERVSTKIRTDRWLTGQWAEERSSRRRWLHNGKMWKSWIRLDRAFDYCESKSEARNEAMILLSLGELDDENRRC